MTDEAKKKNMTKKSSTLKTGDDNEAKNTLTNERTKQINNQ
jgi:hypothetical protein